MAINVALPAVELSRKSISPLMQVWQDRPTWVLKTVKSPAVALFVNCMIPGASCPESASKFCVIPELFVTPVPLIVRNLVNEESEATVIVNALAPALKTMPLTSIEDDNRPPTSVILETPNVAVSAGPLGTVLGVQFVASNQSVLVGLRFHVALPAWAVCIAETTTSVGRSAHKGDRFMKFANERVFVFMIGRVLTRYGQLGKAN